MAYGMAVASEGPENILYCTLLWCGWLGLAWSGLAWPGLTAIAHRW